MIINVLSVPCQPARGTAPLPQLPHKMARFEIEHVEGNFSLIFHSISSAEAALSAMQLTLAGDGGRWKSSILGDSQWNC